MRKKIFDIKNIDVHDKIVYKNILVAFFIIFELQLNFLRNIDINILNKTIHFYL